MAKAREYWEPTAQRISLEDGRVRLFVRHKHSLGVARETIVRNILREQTVEPFRIRTGFVVNLHPHLVTSDQCDILVYDPTKSQPSYQVDEFIVVPSFAARLIVEVRSHISVNDHPKSISGLSQVFKVWASTTSLPQRTPTFGFGFKSAPFADFVAGIGARVNNDLMNVPQCIAVHHRDFIAVRITAGAAAPQADGAGGPAPPVPVPVCVITDFSRAAPDYTAGIATANFLNLYDLQIQNVPLLYEDWRAYVNSLGLPNDAIKLIAQNGAVTDGPMP